MAVVKVIEVLAQSKNGWEDAAQEAITAAAKSVRNIKTLYVEGMQATIENDKITEYRIDAKISFVVD